MIQLAIRTIDNLDVKQSGMDPDATPSRKILVTGGTGFVGSALVAALRDRGHQVTAMGRTQRALTPWLQDQAVSCEGTVRFLQADLRDRPAVVAACADQDVVYHVGALTAPWGRRRDFEATNVGGTDSVIIGCVQHQVERLIYVSSPSVVFSFSDQFDLRDDALYPGHFSSEYARSKALGEVLVRRAAQQGLKTVIVRPRAVFGPGDTTLFPRLLRVARLGRLPQIGQGDNVTELTYIDNVVHALVLAMICEQANGQTVTITNGQPVALWPVIHRVLATQGLRTSARTVPLSVAMGLAWSLENLWHMLRIPSEPLVTRYSLGLLGYSQTFDISAAKEILGYQPLVSLEQGIARTLIWLRASTDATVAPPRHVPEFVAGAPGKDSSSPVGVTSGTPEQAVSVDVTCDVLATGYCCQSYHHLVRGAEKRVVALPATFALLRHPRHGVILFDTGYAPRSREVCASLPFSIYERMVPVTVLPEWSAVRQLERRGIGPREVRQVILSHFHADHLGGLRDFPEATFITTEAAYARVRGLSGWRALRAAFIPALLPRDFEARLRLVSLASEPVPIPNRRDADPLATEPWSVFPRTLDLFGDGSILLLPLQGHAAGQIGALVRTSRSSRTLLAADGCWSSESYRARQMPPVLVAPILDNWSAARGTLRRLHAVWRTEPAVTIVPCHCPEQHDALLAEMDVPMALRLQAATSVDR
jgi:nucleoside-diphosphate-sugar epimerase/glyoxylase-like metal-dependent hydrolase (beta-lactamase superfamily II)